MALSQIFLPAFGVPPTETTEVSVVDFNDAVQNCTLVVNNVYTIVDRPGGRLYVQAVTSCTVSPIGIREMEIPTTYVIGPDAHGNNWLGVWDRTKTDADFAVNDLAIWGTKVWKNLTGNKGASVDEYSLDSNWELVPTTTANVYEKRFFSVYYDMKHDWITKQVDGAGNNIGMDWYTATQMYGIAADKNPADFTDWNMGTAISFYNNNVEQVLNNVILGGLWNNFGSFIKNNVTPAHISHNTTEWGLFDNTCAEQIEYNTALSVNGNTTGRGIVGNLCPLGGIMDNNITGAIDGNVCVNINNNIANVNDIKYNMFPSSISGNSLTGDIQFNVNNGEISNNSIVGSILNNKNNGSIKQNSGTGTIQFNSNNGDVSLSARAGNISDTIVNK